MPITQRMVLCGPCSCEWVAVATRGTCCGSRGVHHVSMCADTICRLVEGCRSVHLGQTAQSWALVVASVIDVVVLCGMASFAFSTGSLALPSTLERYCGATQRCSALSRATHRRMELRPFKNHVGRTLSRSLETTILRRPYHSEAAALTW